MAVTEQLRKVIIDSGLTHYRISKDTGLAPTVLDRFVSRERPHLHTQTMDTLCEFFGLELRKKTNTTAKKQAAKKKLATKRVKKKKR